MCKILMVGSFNQAIKSMVKKEKTVFTQYGRDGATMLRNFNPDIVIIKENLSDGSAEDFLKKWRGEKLIKNEAKVVLVGGENTGGDNFTTLATNSLGRIIDFITEANSKKSVGKETTLIKRLEFVRTQAQKTQEVLTKGLSEG